MCKIIANLFGFFVKSIKKSQDNVKKSQNEEVFEMELKESEAWKELLERVKKHEGFSSKPYKCPAGKLTIAYGRNIEDNGITKDEAEYLLINDLTGSMDELLKNFPWVDTMSIRRQYVLVEMVFNMGIAKFKQFKKMIEYCRIGDYEKAAEQALDSAWHKQVGKRAETLAKILKEG